MNSGKTGMLNLKSLKKKATVYLTKLKIAREKRKDAQRRLRDAIKLEAAAREAQLIIQELAAEAQEYATTNIETIVSRCLDSIFAETYQFKIHVERKRNKTEVRLAFIRDGEEFDPIDDTGGGIVDVASFGLRVATLMIKQPQPRRLLILDEPFKFVSEDYRNAVRYLIEELSTELDIQFICVTHMEEFELGKVVRL